MSRKILKFQFSAAVPGLKWLNEEKNIFRMPWKHAGRQDYNLEDSKIFMEWAKHSGKFLLKILFLENHDFSKNSIIRNTRLLENLDNSKNFVSSKN